MKRVVVLFSILCITALGAGCAKKPKMDSAQSAADASGAVGALEGSQSVGVKEQGITDQGGAPAGGSEASRGMAPIYFDFDSYLLSESSMQILTRNAEWLKNNPDMKTMIEGHADDRGSDEYNLALGEKRARMAKDYLVNLGVPPERMNTISYGEEKPAVEGEDESSWSKNRRVEFL